MANSQFESQLYPTLRTSITCPVSWSTSNLVERPFSNPFVAAMQITDRPQSPEGISGNIPRAINPNIQHLARGSRPSASPIPGQDTQQDPGAKTSQARQGASGSNLPTAPPKNAREVVRLVHEGLNDAFRQGMRASHGVIYAQMTTELKETNRLLGFPVILPPDGFTDSCEMMLKERCERLYEEYNDSFVQNSMNSIHGHLHAQLAVYFEAVSNRQKARAMNTQQDKQSILPQQTVPPAQTAPQEPGASGTTSLPQQQAPSTTAESAGKSTAKPASSARTATKASKKQRKRKRKERTYVLTGVDQSVTHEGENMVSRGCSDSFRRILQGEELEAALKRTKASGSGPSSAPESSSAGAERGQKRKRDDAPDDRDAAKKAKLDQQPGGNTTQQPQQPALTEQPAENSSANEIQEQDQTGTQKQQTQEAAPAS